MTHEAFVSALLLPVILLAVAAACPLFPFAALELAAIWGAALLASLLLGRWLAWRRYMIDLAETGAPRKALELLNQASPTINILGHFIPAALII
jgi:hypothetical protein